MAFNIKQNDTSPSLGAQLLDGSKQIIDLTGASVRFHMKIAGGSAVAVDGAATVSNAAEGRVQYEWAAGDTTTAANYQGEFEVTYPNGTVETFPNSGYIVVRVIPEIA